MSTEIWLPFALDDAGGSVGEVGVWDGEGDPPDGIEHARFFVPPQSDRAFEPVPRMTGLEVVQVLSAGVDSVRDQVPDGVTLCNARGAHDDATSEQAVALTLAGVRELADLVRAQDRGEWSPRTTRTLSGATVLILGYGSIGAAVERRLAGFECEVLRVARRARTVDAGPVLALDALPGLLPRADVVIVLLPQTEDTRGSVDAAFLTQLPDGALLVNVARGPIVDTDALLAELSSGRLRAALDVTDPEPLPADHPLWHAPGVIVTPHTAGATTTLEPRLHALLREQLRRWSTGEPLQNVVDGAY